MACRQVSFDGKTGKPSLLGSLALFGGIAFVIGFGFVGKSLFNIPPWQSQMPLVYVGIACGIVGLVIGFFVWAIRRHNAGVRAALIEFKKLGYHTDFQLDVLLIDSRAKVMAFVNPACQTIDLYSTRDVLGWEHQWVNHTTAQVNAWGDRVSGRTTANENVIVIKTNNPANPIYRIPVVGHAAGQFWMARLSAVING